MREMLREFLRRAAADLTLMDNQNGARTGGALMYFFIGSQSPARRAPGSASAANT
jgi:hypothetical protein